MYYNIYINYILLLLPYIDTFTASARKRATLYFICTIRVISYWSPPAVMARAGVNCRTPDVTRITGNMIGNLFIYLTKIMNKLYFKPIDTITRHCCKTLHFVWCLVDVALVRLGKLNKNVLLIVEKQFIMFDLF